MFRVLIADAERDVRKRLREYINSSGSTFRVVKEAENGRQALEELAGEQVDLVICELRLPLLSGYQLLMKLKTAFPDTRLILYGDYSEMETLQKAEAEGLLAYLLKPVKLNDLERALVGAAKELEELYKKNYEEKKIINKYEQVLPVFQDRFLINLVHGHLEDDRDILSGFGYFKLNLQPSYRVMVLKVDYFNKLSLVFDEREKEIFIFTLASKIQEYLHGKGNGTAFINNYDEIALIMGSGIDLAQCYKMAEDIKQLVRQETVTTVTVGIGMPFGRESEIYVSYKQAKAALRYSHRFGSNAVIYIGSVEPGNIITYRYPEKKEELLIYQTVIGNRQAMLMLLEELYRSLKSFDNLPDKLLPKLALNVLVSISRYASEQGINLEELFAKHLSVRELSSKENIDAVFDYLRTLLNHICDYIEKVRNDSDESMLEAAKEYIRQHYKENIQLQDVAVQVNSVPEYLDKLIRQKDKMPFSDYIARVRIDEAKQLLKTTELDDLAVAIRVGYDDEKYFASVFYKLEGISVADYRRSLKPKLYNNIYIQ